MREICRNCGNHAPQEHITYGYRVCGVCFRKFTPNEQYVTVHRAIPGMIRAGYPCAVLRADARFPESFTLSRYWTRAEAIRAATGSQIVCISTDYATIVARDAGVTHSAVNRMLATAARDYAGEEKSK